MLPSSPGRRLALRVTMCVGYFLVLLDVTVVNVALPDIGRGFGSSIAQLQWVVDAYAIVLASAMLVCGSIGDARGHRPVVIAGLAVFGLASLGCGVAPGPAWLIGARAAQGAGAALLLPGTLAVISRSAEDERGRARAIALWAAVGGAALPAGPLLGGALVDTLGWRAVFLLNVPVVAAALPAVLRLLRADASPGAHGGRLDVAGAAIGALMLGAVTFTFIEAGRAGAPPALIAAGGGAGAALIAAFLAVERRSPAPMLPLGMFRRPRFTVGVVCAGTMNLGTLGTLFVVTQFLQTVQGRSALAAGTIMLANFVPMALLPPLVGRVVARVGPRVPVATGLLVAGAGLASLVAVGPHTPVPLLLPTLAAWGVGLAILTPAVVAAAMGGVEQERAGLASAVTNTARQAAGAVGIAGLGAFASALGIVPGLRLAGLTAAALYALAAVLAIVGLRSGGSLP